MMKKLSDVMTADSFVGYVETALPINQEATELAGLFPLRIMPGLDYSYITTDGRPVELTAPSAFDAEPINQNRESFDAMAGQLPLFRKKMHLTEKEKVMLSLYMRANDVAGMERLITNIYDDQRTLIRGARMTMEFLRSRALMDGKISINSKGGAVSVDYLVPSEHKITLAGDETWEKPAAPIIEQIKKWMSLIEDKTGIKPTKMLMNSNTYAYFAKNLQLRNHLMPIALLAQTAVANALPVSDMQILESLKAATGLTSITVYNRKVYMDGTNLDLIEDNKIVLFPDGELGNTLVGTSPAELYVQTGGEANVAVTSEGIAINVSGTDKAPYTVETQVEFIALPSFIASNVVVQVKVK